VVATLCPALVSAAVASGDADREFSTLYSAIYRAFTKRRSLLLLNYEKQVTITELPWVKALDANRAKKVTASRDDASRTTLEDVVAIALRNWPETMFPNKFVSVLYDLANSSGSSSGVSFGGLRKEFPFVKELASDIFMGGFSDTFVQAAKIAAGMLQGTLYERYYQIPYKEVITFTKVEQLNELCTKQVGPTTKRWDVVNNGKIIEQCMIVTTHNLALVFQNLGMREKLASFLPAMAKKSFIFIINELKNLASMDWQTRLQRIKNGSYAFRQMVFYLSFLTEQEVGSFFEWAFQRCEKLEPSFKSRLLQPLTYLRHVWKGTADPAGALIFLGWTSDRHFMMPDKVETPTAKK